jgi:hypothetical protein
MAQVIGHFDSCPLADATTNAKTPTFLSWMDEQDIRLRFESTRMLICCVV